MSGRVLIFEDEQLLRWSLKEQLSKSKFEVIEAATGQEGLKKFNRQPPDLILLDVRLPDADGLSLLKTFQKADPGIPAIIMTAHGNVELVIQAMKSGASNYIDKPFNFDELLVKIELALERSKLAREVRYLREQNGLTGGFANMVAESPAMKDVVELIRKVSNGPLSNVLIQGESGTGKDVVARSLHSASPRFDKPFMNITCSALTDQLLDSELFGHEKGAFTDASSTKKGLLEVADGGTVFLDEIGETSPAFQAKLLRFLEEKAFKRVGGVEDIHVDVRVIAATNRNLVEEVEKSNFREDLFYRLNIIDILLPPLRDRSADIVPLARHFMNSLKHEFKCGATNFSATSEEHLCTHTWPGNVRELRNCVERALIFCTEGPIKPEHLTFGNRPTKQMTTETAAIPSNGLNFEQDVEKIYVQRALEMSDGNHTKAANLLGMNRDQIRYRIKKFGL